VPCCNCSRRFTPDRIAVHERLCKGPKKPPPTAAAAAAAAEDDNDEEDAQYKPAPASYRVRWHHFA